MKKLVVLITLLVLCSMVRANGVLSPDEELKLYFYKYDPSPLQPGQPSEITLAVKNLGYKDIENFKITYVEKYPFTISDPKRLQQIIPKIQAGTVNYITFPLFVDPDAADSIEQIRFQYTYGDIKQTISETGYVTIKRTNTIVSLEKITTNPEMFKPGEIGSVYLTLENNAGYTMRDIKVKLDLSNTTFSPVKSTTEKRIKSLNLGESSLITFDLATDPDAESKVYKVPVTITYYDEVGAEYKKEVDFGIQVFSDPELVLTLSKSEIYKKGMPGNIVLSLANSGTSQIKFLTLTILDDKNYEIISKNSEYIGNLDSDDYETVDFDMYVSSGKQKVPIQVKLDYKDAFNIEKTEIREVELPIYSISKASAYGLMPSSNLGKLIIYFILITFGWFSFSEWRKKRNIPHALKEGSIRELKLWRKMIKSLHPKKILKCIKGAIAFFKKND